MKAIILPDGEPELLDPMTTWMSESLIPVVNKPVVEHLIELLVRNNIKEIILVLKHMPYETEQYFGNGERWGVQISYSLEKEYADIGSCLNRIKSRLHEDFLFMSGNIVTDIKLSEFIKAHESVPGAMTIARQKLEEEDGALVALSSDKIKKNATFGPVIMTPECLSCLLAGPRIQDLGQAVTSLLAQGLSLYAYHSSYSLRTIDSLNDYLEVNKLALNGGFKGLIIPGEQKQEGIWVGRRTNIHPEAEIFPPSYLGNYCNVRKGTVIGEGTIIGDNVIVDHGVSIAGSVILDSTYIGSHTEIKDAVIKKNTMIDVSRSTSIYVKDDFILGDMDKKILADKSERFYNLLFAILLLLVFSPIIAVLFLYHLVLPSRRFFSSEEYFGGYEVVDFQGNVEPGPFNLYKFQTKNRLLQKLPGLFNVIKGDMNLVGNSPLTGEEVAGLEEEWEMMRFKASAGLFHLWEVEGGPDITREEKLVTENYYAATRTFWGDVKILLKSLLPSGILE